MNRKTLTLVLAATILCLLDTPSLFSQLKGYAFLRNVTGARQAAMGGAYTAMAGDLHAIVANPAALTQLTQKQAAFDYVNQVLDIQSGFGAYLHPLSHGNLAFSLYFQDYGKLQKLDEFGNELGDLSANSFILSAAYARPYTESIWLGGALKYFQSSLAGYSSGGLAVDLGIYVTTKAFENLRIAAGIYNLGTVTSAYISTKDALPTRIEIGIAKKLAHLPLEYSISAIKYLGDNFQFAMGGEFTITENAFLRLGYNSIGQDQKLGLSDDRFAGLAGGLGLNYKNYRFDYAYSSSGVLGSVNRISLAYSF